MAEKNKETEQTNNHNGNSRRAKPEYTGKVQIGDGIDRQTVGKVAIWNNENPSSERSPIQTGTVTIEIPEIDATRTYRISIWKNVPKEE